MNNFIATALCSIPLITFSGGIPGLPEPTLLVDNTNGKRTIIILNGNTTQFVHASGKKEIELVKDEEGCHPIKLLKTNTHRNTYEQYLIHIKNLDYVSLSKLNAATMQEEGSTDSLRIIKVLLERTKAKL